MANLTHSTDEMRLLAQAEHLFAPLIREGMFADFEQAFRALLLDYIDRQIGRYKTRVAEFEAHHQQSFEAFTTTLQGRAYPAEEEAWMDWEAALAFLSKWERIQIQVANGASG